MERVTTPNALLRGAPADHYILRVVGDALAPEFKDGDFLVLLRESRGEAGDLVLARIGDVVTIHRLEADGSCEGIVVGLMRRYDKS